MYDDLLKEYNIYERPVAHAQENVTVSVGLVLQQIVDVDEKNQEVEVNAWLKLTWYDYKLHWDPEKYGGITEVRFRKSQIWTPDILLYNSVSEEFDSLYPANILVYSNGLTTWIPPAIFKLSAKIHVAWFPFDSQICQLKFGSWTYDGSKIDLRLDENGFDLSTYIPNGEWEIKSVDAERHIQFYKCCVEPYFDIVFTFQIQRKTLFYGFNLIVPCIAITLLTIVGFAYPSEAGEKMSIRTYFLFTIITVSMSVVGTVIIVNIHNRTVKTHHMAPTLMKVFLVKLPKILMMKSPRVRFIPKDYDVEAPEELKRPRETLKQIFEENNLSFETIPTINELCRKPFEDDIESHGWKYMGIVFDRIALLICVSFVFICTAVLFCSASFG
ncbi:hypothetical protein FO519_001998 [Halicephalobus sp. NKZ332]|nr:hypothetical protein FO519_001998 [Halicephalobus sp. NKZ332]